MRGMLAVVALVGLAAAAPHAQQPRPDKAAQMKVEEIVTAYGGAWNETDVDARRKMLEKAWAENGVYTDPGAHVEGREALMQHIAGFQKAMPGARLALTSRVDVHHNVLRFSWRLQRADGATVTDGIDFGTLDADGKIVRIVGFFGPFTPLDR